MDKCFISWKRALEFASKFMGLPVSKLKIWEDDSREDRVTLRCRNESNFDYCTIYLGQKPLEDHCAQHLVEILGDLKDWPPDEEGLDDEKVYRSLLATARLDDLIPWIVTESRFLQLESKEIEHLLKNPVLAIRRFVTDDSFKLVREDSTFFEEAVYLIACQCRCDAVRLAHAVLQAHGGSEWFCSVFMAGRLTFAPEGLDLPYPIFISRS